MPASLNTEGRPPTDAERSRRNRRREAAPAFLFALLILALGLALRPGPASALVEPSPAGARHLQDPPTPTLQPGTGAVAGQAWIDGDGDGLFDPGEQPLSGMSVAAKSYETGATLSATSGADGKYSVLGLSPGLYRITATPPASYEMTTSSASDVYISASVVLTLNFGARVPPTATPSPTPPPLLDTEGAEILTCGGVYTGNTETGENNVNTYGCRPWWDESGKERVYRLELTARQPITVTLLDTSADLDLFLLRYASPDSCVAAGDNYLALSADIGPYFLSVDGYRGASGSYSFRLDCPVDVQATSTPTFTPSATPTPTATGTPAAAATPTPTQKSEHAYLPLLLVPQSGPTPLPVTFVLQDGLNGYTGTSDTTLNSWFPADSFGADDELQLHFDRSAEISSQKEAVIRFDLSLLPRGATVNRAILRLYVRATPRFDIRALVAGLLRSWDEPSASWQLAATDQPWATPGASAVGSDRTEWVSEPQRIVEGSRWYEFDITDLVQQWSALPSLNHGVIVSALAGDSDASWGVAFVSREGASLWRPQLVISYTLATAAAE